MTGVQTCALPIFFFKQKTAYELYQCDCSSDVCSSDLSLVASHIKPYIKSNEDEKYDPDNGLLLSRNMDILFDQGYISFKNTGEIKVSSRIPKELIKHLSMYKLNMVYLNKKRLKYLEYHRKKVFK